MVLDPPGLLLALLIAAPLGLALALGFLPRRTGALLGALLLGAEALALARARPVGSPLRFSLPWIETWGVAFTLRLDGLAWVFSLLATGIGAAVFAFAAGHMPYDQEAQGSRRPLRSFYQLLLVFLASMLGVVCADDLVTLYVFWELITIASFLLIGFHLQDEKARRAALHSLALTGGSGLFFFASLMLLLHVGGSASLEALSSRPIGWLAEAPTAPLIALGILLTAAAKSVQFPFYGWLPAAMAAPAPVSALLHSATLVASGAFLLARFLPVLAPLPGFSGTLVLLGAATALLAGGTALARTKLKEILAWSTVSYHGQAVLLLGLGAEEEAVYFLAFHALAKAGLFLAAGAITQSTRHEDIRNLGGLWRSHPALTAITLVLALGLAGFPPAAGFWMKELLFHEAYVAEKGWLVPVAFGIAILSVSYFVRLCWCVFFSRPRAEFAPSLKPLSLLVAPGLLTLLFLLAGIFPGAGAWLGNPPPFDPVDLHVPWPWEPYVYGAIFSLPLGLVAATWLHGMPPGLAGRKGRPQSPNQVIRNLANRAGASRLFEATLAALRRLGHWASRLQTGRLLHYLVPLVLLPVIAGAFLLPRAFAPLPPPPTDTPSPTLVFLGAAIGALSLASTVVRSHVSALLTVGAVGYLIALLFATLRAPDIAFMQMTVETATALLLLAALSRIPRTMRSRVLGHRGRRSPGAGALTALGALLLGLVLGTALMASIVAPSDPSLGQAFYPLTKEAGEDSVVKAVLADFRAMDTLGEATVFATAVLGAILVLGRRIERTPGGGSRRREEP